MVILVEHHFFLSSIGFKLFIVSLGTNLEKKIHIFQKITYLRTKNLYFTMNDLKMVIHNQKEIVFYNYWQNEWKTMNRKFFDIY